ncbi:unnamed protein product [Symbiodinium natans]|uniref:Uncharacterized protein n=1 Tax=Symbiodinium natans TaxID=878477 RepID=A0A812Q207_9DINO|nr:unnamed protein product [Symbiodinium natans]
MESATSSPFLPSQQDVDGSPPPSFASAVLRRLSHLESKFSAQLSKAQQEGERLREATLAKAVALAKDTAMAEFSQIVKGMSEVLQLQLRRMDHLEAQWRQSEPTHGVQVQESPVRGPSDAGSFHSRLLQVEELLERCCQHEEAMGSELLQLAARLRDVEARGEAAEPPLESAGFFEREDKLEDMLSSLQQKIEVLQEDSRDIQERVEAQEERGRCLRALTDAKEEHYRSLVERFERASVEPRLKQLQVQSREAESQLATQAEAIELLAKRLEDEAQYSLQSRQSPRLAKPQAWLEQRVVVLEGKVEGCWKGLDQANGCLGQLEEAILKHFAGESFVGDEKPARPLIMEEPETRLPGAVA